MRAKQETGFAHVDPVSHEPCCAATPQPCRATVHQHRRKPLLHEVSLPNPSLPTLFPHRLRPLSFGSQALHRFLQVQLALKLGLGTVVAHFSFTWGEHQ